MTNTSSTSGARSDVSKVIRPATENTTTRRFPFLTLALSLFFVFNFRSRGSWANVSTRLSRGAIPRRLAHPTCKHHPHAQTLRKVNVASKRTLQELVHAPNPPLQIVLFSYWSFLSPPQHCSCSLCSLFWTLLAKPSFRNYPRKNLYTRAGVHILRAKEY